MVYAWCIPMSYKSFTHTWKHYKPSLPLPMRSWIYNFGRNLHGLQYHVFRFLCLNMCDDREDFWNLSFFDPPLRLRGVGVTGFTIYLPLYNVIWISTAHAHSWIDFRNIMLLKIHVSTTQNNFSYKSLVKIGQTRTYFFNS